MASQTQKRPGIVEEFLDEFRAVWPQVPNKGLFVGLLAAWLALFQFLGNSTFGYYDTSSLLQWLWGAYGLPPKSEMTAALSSFSNAIHFLRNLAFNFGGNSEDSHGVLIPVVVIFILWFKRRALMALPRETWYPGLLLIAASICLHIAGYLVQQPRISAAALFLGIYSLIGLVWGRSWFGATFFPCLLFVFCIPVATLSEPITFPMRLLVAKISVGISHSLLGVDVIRDGTQIFDPQRTFQYDVAPACSGIRSLVALVALSTVYGFLAFTPWWKRLFMILLAAPLAIVGNVVRITVVIVVAEAFGHNTGKAIEQNFGFITFICSLVAVFVVGHFIRDREPSRLQAATLDVKAT